MFSTLSMIAYLYSVSALVESYDETEYKSYESAVCLVVFWMIN